MAKVQKTIPFTIEKYKEMQQKVAELEELREEVMKRLVTAREMGDLSENGAYKYAKFELGNIGRQMRKYKGLLAKGFPAPKHTGSKGTIDFGSEVTIEKIDSKKKTRTFTIVSGHESDPSLGKLAYSSPMGKALMRKKVGDAIKVETPIGVHEYKIISIK
jgi:transcription elongation factor GreA